MKSNLNNEVVNVIPLPNCTLLERESSAAELKRTPWQINIYMLSLQVLMAVTFSAPALPPKPSSTQELQQKSRKFVVWAGHHLRGSRGRGVWNLYIISKNKRSFGMEDAEGADAWSYCWGCWRRLTRWGRRGWRWWVGSRLERLPEQYKWRQF